MNSSKLKSPSEIGRASCRKEYRAEGRRNTRWPRDWSSDVFSSDLDLAAWFGLLAPAGTPDNVLEFLSSSISEILAEEQTQKQLEALGALPVGSTPAEFNELIKAEITKWEQVVEENQLERL